MVEVKKTLNSLNFSSREEEILGKTYSSTLGKICEQVSEVEELCRGKLSPEDVLEYLLVVDILNPKTLQTLINDRQSALQFRMNKIRIGSLEKRYQQVSDDFARIERSKTEDAHPVLGFLIRLSFNGHFSNGMRILEEQANKERRTSHSSDREILETTAQTAAQMAKNSPREAEEYRQATDVLLGTLFGMEYLQKNPLPPEEEKTEVFERYQNASLKSARPSTLSLGNLAIKVSLPQPGETFSHGQLCHFEINYPGSLLPFRGTLSRLDGELHPPGDMVVTPLRALFQTKKLTSAYVSLRNAVLKTLESAIEKGEFQCSLPVDVETLQVSSPVESEVFHVAEQVQGTIEEIEPSDEAQSEPLKPEEGTRFSKGERTSLRGLEIRDILRAFRNLKIVPVEESRGAHLILNRSTPTGRVTYPFPNTHGQGKTTGNITRILNTALRRFGVKREEFLSALNA